jgi:hypothetical protein
MVGDIYCTQIHIVLTNHESRRQTLLYHFLLFLRSVHSHWMCLELGTNVNKFDYHSNVIPFFLICLVASGSALADLLNPLS